jgi:hypothetical protein
MNFEPIVLALVKTRIAGSLPTKLPCKFLNQKCGRPRMLENAHIRSMDAALIRALAAGAGFQRIETDEDPVLSDTLEISRDLQSRHPQGAVDLDGHTLFGWKATEERNQCRTIKFVMVRFAP